MREWKNVVFAVVCIAAGALMSSYFGADLTAQQQVELLTRAPMEQVNEAEAWEIYHGSQSAFGGNSAGDSYFYVIKHNTLTGETLIHGCEEDQRCVQFAVEVQD